MTFDRGDVVVAIDPFKADATTGRPFVILTDDATPFHGEQYVTCALTTRTWHDERLPLSDDDWVEGGAPKSSSVMPWSVNTIKADWIDFHQGRLSRETVAQAITQLEAYLE